MAALPGVHQTAVGYCGGTKEQPSYKSVCGDPSYNDYAEAITIDFDPTVLSYTEIIDAFFRSHDALAGGRSRQYSSIIFAHDDNQHAIAAQALASQPRATTSLERAAPFWEAESYHQKWLLQRKRPLMLALGLTEYDELLGPAATMLNAVAGGRMRERVAIRRLDGLLERGAISGAAHGELCALLQPF